MSLTAVNSKVTVFMYLTVLVGFIVAMYLLLLFILAAQHRMKLKGGMK